MATSPTNNNNNNNNKQQLVVQNVTSDFSRIVFEIDNGKSNKKKPEISSFLTKLDILLSRSSGRDKFLGVIQYGSMFLEDQRFLSISHGKDAPWKKLEDSMSSGRKTLRLFKWIKESERVSKAFIYPDPGPHKTKLRMKIMSILGFFMHSCSFVYYFVDNLIYLSQTGLINKPKVTSNAEFRKSLRQGLSPSEFLKLQARFRSEEVLKNESRAFEDKLKDWKNYSSLFRLLAAICYCTVQIDSLNTAENEFKNQPKEDGTSNQKNFEKKLQEFMEKKADNIKEILASICNLIILLSRLKFYLFKDLPLWSIGLFGVVANLFGVEKNWPFEKKA